MNNEKGNLTKREEEVIILLKRGMSNNEIAEELNISVTTAQNHVSSIMEKLNIHDRKKIIILKDN
ncbi:MAG TPA: LuxR C-terminal-related transcriptional regulator [Ruminiclostridium sp.]